MPITFTKTKLPYGWLGNMASFPIKYNGKEWRSNEALFQALRFNDESIQEEIRLQKSPMSAKIVAKKNADKMVVEQRSQKDLENMDMVVRLKLEQHPDLKRQLLETGEELIIEDVTKRGVGGSNLFWGMALVDGNWTGQNVLGNILMNIRTELRINSF